MLVWFLFALIIILLIINLILTGVCLAGVAAIFTCLVELDDEDDEDNA